MTEVVPQRLWLGHVGDVQDLRAVLDAGVAALVDLASNEPIPRLTRDLVYCRFPLVDGAGNDPELLRLAIETSVLLLRAQMPTLIYCSAGISRSLAISAAAWAVVMQMPLEHCLQQFAKAKAHDLSPGLWADVVQASLRRPFGA